MARTGVSQAGIAAFTAVVALISATSSYAEQNFEAAFASLEARLATQAAEINALQARLVEVGPRDTHGQPDKTDGQPYKSQMQRLPLVAEVPSNNEKSLGPLDSYPLRFYSD